MSDVMIAIQAGCQSPMEGNLFFLETRSVAHTDGLLDSEGWSIAIRPATSRQEEDVAGELVER
jgi:hypothetical protein